MTLTHLEENSNCFFNSLVKIQLTYLKRLIKKCKYMIHLPLFFLGGGGISHSIFGKREKKCR
jgi:hypothetical protein